MGGFEQPNANFSLQLSDRNFICFFPAIQRVWLWKRETHNMCVIGKGRARRKHLLGLHLTCNSKIPLQRAEEVKPLKCMLLFFTHMNRMQFLQTTRMHKQLHILLLHTCKAELLEWLMERAGPITSVQKPRLTCDSQDDLHLPLLLTACHVREQAHPWRVAFLAYQGPIYNTDPQRTMLTQHGEGRSQ